MTKIAMLGTGLIGSGLAEAAAGRGEQVVAWNRTIDKARALEEFGVTVAATAADAVRGCTRVHVVLSDDAAVDAVLAQCEAAIGGAVVVDHTTASPAGTKARAERLDGLGIAYLHAPVFMSPAMCREAKGIIVTSGPRAVYDRVADALVQMTGKVQYLGERRDLAAANKLFGNALIITLTAGLADVFAMAKSLDIDPRDALSLFSLFNPVGTLTYRGKAMSEGSYEPSFELNMARKDVRLMVEAAGGEPLAVLSAIASRMDKLIAEGHGGDDLGVLAVSAVAPRDPE